MCGISPLSLSLPLPVVSKPCFRLTRRHSSEAFLARSPCCCCFLALCLPGTVASVGPHQLVCGCSCPSSRVRFWWLARWGYETFPGDSVSFWARHPSLFLPSSNPRPCWTGRRISSRFPCCRVLPGTCWGASTSSSFFPMPEAPQHLL